MSKSTVNYASFDLPIISSRYPQLVPSSCDHIELSLDDRKALALSVLNNMPALLIGETGTGKTSVCKELAFLTKRPYVRVNMSGFTTPDDLIGSKSVAKGATYWEHGVITHAMQVGAILVLDEINATMPDCLFILHGLLDTDHQITLPNGEVIKPHEDFRVFATCNPDYAGTKAINAALLDRFPIILAVDVLPMKEEQELIEKRTKIDSLTAEKLVAIATLLRKSYKEGKITTFASTRALLNIASLIQLGLDSKIAYNTVITRKTQNQDEQHILSDIYHAIYKLDNSDDSEMPVVTNKGTIKKYENDIERLRNEIVNAVEQRDKEIKRQRAAMQKVKAKLLEAKQLKSELAALKDSFSSIESSKNVLSKISSIFQSHISSSLDDTTELDSCEDATTIPEKCHDCSAEEKATCEEYQKYVSQMTATTNPTV